MENIVVWNTGRLYTEVGQVIAAVEVAGGVVFRDVSRMIDGFVRATPERIKRDGVQRVAMWGYDTGAPTGGGGYKYNYESVYHCFGHGHDVRDDVLRALTEAARAYIARTSKAKVA